MARTARLVGQFAERHLIVMFLPRYYQEYLHEALNAINEDGVKMLGRSFPVLVKVSFFDFLNFHMKVYRFTFIHYMTYIASNS